MVKFIVEIQERNGGSWLRHGSFSDESSAIRGAQSQHSSRPDRSYRVVDDKGNVRFVL
jgi:hypothetical protein